MRFYYRVTLEYDKKPMAPFTPHAADLHRWLIEAVAAATGIERPARIVVEADREELPS